MKILLEGCDKRLLIHIQGDGRCALTITATSLTDEESWWVIWNARVELSGVCVRQGKQACRTNLGMSNSDLSIQHVN